MRESSDANAETSTGLAVKSLVHELPPLPKIGDAALRDRLVDLEQARNVIEAEQAQVMVEMHQRAAAEDAARDAALTPEARVMIPAHEARLVEFVSDEIAVLLVCAPMLASHRLDAALDIIGHQAVIGAWSTGSIDARKAAVIASGVRKVDPVFVDALAAQATQYATTHTAPQTRAWLAHQVITADPGAAEIRRASASEGRRVALTPLDDGMAELSALLPSIQARQAYDTLNALAQCAPPNDARTMDQRRADALMDLITGRAEPPQVNIQVVVPAATLDGDADLPGVIPGLGPITGHEARRLANGTGKISYRPLIVDPETGAMLESAAEPPTDTTTAPPSGYRPSAALDRAVRTRDLTCRFPGCRRTSMAKASGTDLDHSIPWPAGPTAWSNLVVLCRHHHRLKHSAGWKVDLAPDGGLTWTTPTGRHHTTHPWHYTDPPDTG